LSPGQLYDWCDAFAKGLGYIESANRQHVKDTTGQWPS
jgi:hypothetical protein